MPFRGPYEGLGRMEGKMPAEQRYVYLLRSERDPCRHYVGLTADVQARLAAQVFWAGSH